MADTQEELTPERIWLLPCVGLRVGVVDDHKRGGDTEYIRADLARPIGGLLWWVRSCQNGDYYVYEGSTEGDERTAITYQSTRFKADEIARKHNEALARSAPVVPQTYQRKATEIVRTPFPPDPVGMAAGPDEYMERWRVSLIDRIAIALQSEHVVPQPAGNVVSARGMSDAEMDYINRHKAMPPAPVQPDERVEEIRKRWALSDTVWFPRDQIADDVDYLLSLLSVPVEKKS